MVAKAGAGYSEEDLARAWKVALGRTDDEAWDTGLDPRHRAILRDFADALAAQQRRREIEVLVAYELIRRTRDIERRWDDNHLSWSDAVLVVAEQLGNLAEATIDATLIGPWPYSEALAIARDKAVDLTAYALVLSLWLAQEVDQNTPPDDSDDAVFADGEESADDDTE